MSIINFKSQICTTKEQSERLIALGLKKETADMTIHIKDDDGWYVTAEPFCEWEDDRNTFPSLEEPEPIVPAWTLHRLIEMMPFFIDNAKPYTNTKCIYVSKEDVILMDYEDGEVIEAWQDNNLYDNILRCIEWLVKEGCFNKEYLEKTL